MAPVNHGRPVHDHQADVGAKHQQEALLEQGAQALDHDDEDVRRRRRLVVAIQMDGKGGAKDCPHDICVIWCMPECWDQSGQKLVEIPEAPEYLAVAKEYFANFPHLLLIAPGDTSWHTEWTEDVHLILT